MLTKWLKTYNQLTKNAFKLIWPMQLTVFCDSWPLCNWTGYCHLTRDRGFFSKCEITIRLGSPSMLFCLVTNTIAAHCHLEHSCYDVCLFFYSYVPLGSYRLRQNAPKGATNWRCNPPCGCAWYCWFVQHTDWYTHKYIQLFTTDSEGRPYGAVWST